jgi:hypothetical protein
VFNDPENDLVIDFWKRNIGVDVAFNHLMMFLTSAAACSRSRSPPMNDLSLYMKNVVACVTSGHAATLTPQKIIRYDSCDCRKSNRR